ncbi:MAG: hypothetical protein QM831_25615 [Kofleriaceae bacterium]
MKIWVVVMLAGCDSATLDLEPETSNDACYSLDACAMATGTDLRTMSVVRSDDTEGVGLDAVYLDTLDVVSVTSDRTGATFHAIAPGLAHVHAKMGDYAMDSTLRVADIATTNLQLLRPAVVAAPPMIAAFPATELLVQAQYFDLRGNPLVGHGVEDWALTGGVVQQQYDFQTYGEDSALMQFVSITGDAELSAHGATLSVKQVPFGSTASISLGQDALTIQRQIAGVFILMAKTADGLSIYGDAPATLTSSDPTIATADISARRVSVTPHAPGSTTLTIVFDGAQLVLPVTVTQQ